MAVLVTGGAGYVGFNVVEALLASGREVMTVDRTALRDTARRVLAPHAGRLVALTGDLCDAKSVADVFAIHSIDGVIHCAAVTSGAQREAQDPVGVVETNIKATINVLEAARRKRVRRVVFTSSSTVYGESAYRLPRLYEDSSPAVPVTLYGITKFAAERACLRLRELWDMDIVAVRLGTVVGPWEWNTGVRDPFGTHSQVARLALTGKEAVLPQREVRRDWVYSRDVAAGLIALLDAPTTRNAVYNLASGKDWGRAISAWCDSLKSTYPDFAYRAAAEGEVPNVTYTDKDRSPMDIGRITDEFGFQPRGPASAYSDFIEWMKHIPDFWAGKEERHT